MSTFKHFQGSKTEPPHVKFSNIHIECSQPNTLTIIRCPDMPQELLPLDVSTDNGEIQFEFPYVISIKLGVAIDLTSISKHMETICFSNRIRFHMLDACWFPLLSPYHITSYRTNVIALNFVNLVPNLTLSQDPHTLPTVLDIEATKDQLEYVYLNKSKPFEETSSKHWTHCRVDLDASLIHNDLVTKVPFSLGSRILKRAVATVSVTDIPRTLLKSVVTLVHPDKKLIITCIVTTDAFYLLGIDATEQTDHKNVQVFFRDYLQKLDTLTCVQIIAQQLCSKKVESICEELKLQTMTPFFETLSAEELQRRHINLKNFGRILQKPNHVILVQPLINSSSDRTLQTRFLSECVSVFESGKLKLGFTFLDLISMLDPVRFNKRKTTTTL